MLQFYFKEKFDVLRMFRLLVSSRYRRVRKIWFYLLYLFIQYLKKIIHQSFVSTAPTYGDSRGKVLDNYLLLVPAVPGEVWGL